MSVSSKKSQIVAVVAALIQNEKRQILIAKRKLSLNNGGKWEFPGGKLIPDESPESCLKREIKEELGYDIRVISPFHVVNYSYPHQNILLISYLCSFLGGQGHLTDHDEIQWAFINRLDHYDLSAADVEIVKKLQNQPPDTI